MAKVTNLASLLQMQPPREWHAADTKTPAYDPDTVQAYLANPVQAQTEAGQQIAPMPAPQIGLGEFLRSYLPQFLQGRR